LCEHNRLAILGINAELRTLSDRVLVIETRHESALGER
jgi:hypothetical protein